MPTDPRAQPDPRAQTAPPARTAPRWATVAEFLLDHTRHAPGVAERIDAGEVLLEDGTVVRRDTAYQPGRFVFLHRDLPPEQAVPGALEILHADDDIVVVDKPHFLATMPRGRHVAQTAVIRLRRELGLPLLAPAHRLDRLTAGVLLLTVRPEVRGAYQELFARRQVHKIYEAVAPLRPDLPLPVTLRSHVVKRRGVLQAQEVPGTPNAVTEVELLAPVTGSRSGKAAGGRPDDPSSDRPGSPASGRPGDAAGSLGHYRLTPYTGRTHQLRVQLAGAGIPIVNDPLYPTVRDVRADDFSAPLQLLAREISFTDPLSGHRRRFVSRRRLDRV